MLILSKFKDYYDYLSHVYGVDEKVVLDRIQKEPIDVKLEPWMHPFLRDRTVERSTSIVAVAGKIFFVEQVSTFSDQSFSCKRSVIPVYEKKSWFYGNHRWYSGEFRQSIFDIQKQHKRPVAEFEIPFGCWAVLKGATPNLSAVSGLPGIMDADTTFKSITAFIQEMWGDPDEMTQEPLTDIQKLEAKGFDKKISFRHRKPNGTKPKIKTI